MNQKQGQVIIKLRDLYTLHGALKDAQAEIYARKLERFDLNAITRAVEDVISTWSHKIFPPIAVLEQACQKFAAGGSAPVIEAKHKSHHYPWEAQRRRVSEMAASYTRDFEISSADAHDAKAGGYLHELLRFVNMAACLQAQYIEGVLAPSYQAVLLGYPCDNFDRILKDFMQHSRKQAATGTIRVFVPDHLIREWREQAQRTPAAVTTPRGMMQPASVKMPVVDRAYFESRRPKPPEPEPQHADATHAQG